jgi:hypothetical protein
VTRGNITGWLNELALPRLLQPAAPVDERSGDKGSGALYFSQQCLSPGPRALTCPDITDAAKLKLVQRNLKLPGARQLEMVTTWPASLITPTLPLKMLILGAALRAAVA